MAVKVLLHSLALGARLVRADARAGVGCVLEGLLSPTEHTGLGKNNSYLAKGGVCPGQDLSAPHPALLVLAQAWGMSKPPSLLTSWIPYHAACPASGQVKCCSVPKRR